MKNYLILLSAGKSSRLKLKQKKQYIFINEIPLLDYSLQSFLKSKVDFDIVIVINKDDEKTKAIKYIKNKYKKLITEKRLSIIYGGAERYDSVYSGLFFIKEINKNNLQNINVFIHDSARPFVDKKDIENLYKNLSKYKALSLANKEIYTVRTSTSKSNENIYKTQKLIDRNTLFTMHTPQAFEFELIYKAYKKFCSLNKKLDITDDLQIIEMFAKKNTFFIIGNNDNIKVTTKDDLEYVKYMLSKKYE